MTFQSTFPRRERPRIALDSLILYLVSIHVPAKGTTAVPAGKESETENVSIHVPAKGTTHQ